MENINTVAKNIYTASASLRKLKTLGYSANKVTEKTNISQEDYKDILKGLRPFTKSEYTNIVTAFPIMECCIEYYENVKVIK